MSKRELVRQMEAAGHAFIQSRIRYTRRIVELQSVTPSEDYPVELARASVQAYAALNDAADALRAVGEGAVARAMIFAAKRSAQLAAQLELDGLEQPLAAAS